MEFSNAFYNGQVVESTVIILAFSTFLYRQIAVLGILLEPRVKSMDMSLLLDPGAGLVANPLHLAQTLY